MSGFCRQVKMDSDWAYHGIPIRDWNVTYGVNQVTGEIQIMTQIMGKIETEIVNTKSDQLRNALVDLGWKHPEWVCPVCGKQP